MQAFYYSLMLELDKCVYYTIEDEKAMRAKPVTADEQYRLIMERRSSGLTDYQWSLEHNIKQGTFYNWVKRLRQKGCSDILSAVHSRNPMKLLFEIPVIELFVS